MDFKSSFLYFMIYSFLGWVIETVYCSVIEKRYVPRGFLNGPLTPIYGFGGLAIIFLFQDFQITALIFAGGVFVTSFLEYIASYLLELIFDMHWWDYSADKYNLNGRIKLKNSILFGLLAVVLIKIIHPEVIIWINRLSENQINIFAQILFIMILFDTIITVSSIFGLQKKAQVFKNIDFEERIAVRRNIIHKRILKTFPKLTYLKDFEVIEKIREIAFSIKDNKDN